MTDSIQSFRFVSDSIDILLVTIMFFYILKTIEGTRASQALVGLGAVVALYFISKEWGFYTLNWVLAHFLGFVILIIVILFQDDIRRVLADLGRRPLFLHTKARRSQEMIEELAHACTALSSTKTGAIIAVERQGSLRRFVGKPINAILSSELLVSIFNKNSPLHDGGVIVRDNLIVSAGSFFPISTGLRIEQNLGTRHRAAIELSMETDALLLIISEETGAISVATDGNLKKMNGLRALKNKLVMEFGVKNPVKASDNTRVPEKT